MLDIDENRRTPKELATLCEIEPEMREIIVEGRADAALLEWFFASTSGETDVQVYAVGDRVLLAAEDVISDGNNIGSRGSVVTTASIVHANSSDTGRIIFVADRDCSSVGLDPCPEINNLLFTDFSTMELYYFSPRPLQKLLSVALRAPKELTSENLISDITPVLVSLFLIRATLRSLPEPKKLASKVMQNLNFMPGGHSLDVADALTRSCSGENRDRLMEVYSKFEVPPDSDVRHYIRGHDIAAVIIRYVSSLHARLLREDRRHLAQPDAMSICLVTCLELVDLQDFELFKSLQAFAAR
ncbi:hypothetical protein [Streptomyces sp. NBC_00069]|uniref:hypothetical protein n=1 Tax=Streptomyces sp. NBC_00069 TaxID=2975639 RepID=UPI0032459D36|nr:hypothetical protein OG513_21870 [Streptomyces sp. NBC_00998]